MSIVRSVNFPLPLNIVVDKWHYVKVHFISVIIIIIVSALNNDPASTLIAGGIISFITYLNIAFGEAKKAPAYISLLSFYFFWHSIVFGLSTIFFGTLVLNEERISFSTVTINYNSLVPAYIIYLIGSLFFHVGLEFMRPKLEEKRSKKRTYSIKTILLLALVGVVYTEYLSYFSMLGGFINFLYYGLLAAFSLLAITEPQKLKLSGGSHFALVLFGSTGMFLINISSASKTIMIFSFLPLVWYLIIDKNKWKYLFMIVLFLIPVFFFIIYPLSYELRSQQYSGIGATKSETFNRVLNENKDYLYNYGYEDDYVSAALNRFFYPVSVAYIYQQVDLYGYAEGKTMEYIAYAFIPRLIWPDKPTVTQGAWFAYYTGFASSPETATVSIGITAVGELFWNFGIVSVIVGMVFFGCAFGGLWRMTGNDPRSSALSMLLFLNLLFFITGMSEAVTVLSGIVILFLAFKLLFRLRELFVKV